MITPRLDLTATDTNDLEELWVGSHPVEIEIGCGKARFLLSRAGLNPNIRFLGVERVAKWARISDKKAEHRQLSNLRIVKMDARRLVTLHVPSESVSVFHVYFPDPWPKRRHRKRRLLNAQFLELLNDRLKPGGKVEFATDFKNYYDAMKELAGTQHRFWKKVCERQDNPLFGEGEGTHYEMKFRAVGRTIYYLELEK